MPLSVSRSACAIRFLLSVLVRLCCPPPRVVARGQLLHDRHNVSPVGLGFGGQPLHASWLRRLRDLQGAQRRVDPHIEQRTGDPRVLNRDPRFVGEVQSLGERRAGEVAVPQ